ncbi:DUF4367 domain-containing protein [Paenibacillus segetis]|uniref:DUF4367 domain-containing protein n=1 Tax=Paenibacillus segetis TaxID=1325360 RepID=A0ABQ1YRW3_9BACL|nr:DUF4367 domain-containing protein [Paenibacillus segetis]GGH34389.1 hypothetical protein GCM10008013_40080 [Paenibacillus segetis]
MSPDNNEITEEQLEQFTKCAVQAIHAQIEIPDPEESWKKMRIQLRKRNQRSRWLRASQLGVAIACISIAIGIFAANPNPAYAVKQVIQIIKDTQEGIIHIFFGERDAPPSNGMLTPPPPDITGEKTIPSPITSVPLVTEPKQVSIEEATKLAKFHVLSPEWIPNGYQVDSIQLYPNSDGEYHILRIEYHNKDTELISYMQRWMNESGTQMQTNVQENAGTIKSVQLNDSEGVTIMYEHGGGRIEWLTPDTSTLLQISGNLTEEQLLRMAKSTTKAEDH